MARRVFLLAALLIVLFVIPAAAQPLPPTLSFRFLGNEAWEITDGETTLLTDFPYQPGYGGYMYFAMREVKERSNSLCLITHRHADHFHRDHMRKVDCTVAGPKEVLDLTLGNDILPLDDETRFGPITIRPIKTPHAGLEHFSYLVEWLGIRMYFIGDTKEYGDLFHIGPIEVLFVSPWVASAVLDAGRELPGEKKIIYHHRGRGSLRRCKECIWPRQGYEFQLVAAVPPPDDESTAAGEAEYDEADSDPATDDTGGDR